MPKVVAIGELLIDFTMQALDQDNYPTMRAHPGGAPSNYLAALSAYGISTGLLAKVGDDAFGRRLIDTLRRVGVDTEDVIVDPNVFTTLAFVTLDESGNRSFDFARKPGADTMLTWEEINTSLIDEADYFHFGTLSLSQEPSRRATREAVAYAKEQGKIITFDPNYRKPLWNSEEHARDDIAWGLKQADIVKISDEDLAFFWDYPLDQSAQRIREEFGVSFAMLTMGENGCLLQTDFAECFVPALSVSAVDTTGAGDIFGGSAVAQLLHLQKGIEDLTKDDLEKIGKFATAAAGLSTLKMGGITSIPSMAEVTDQLSRM